MENNIKSQLAANTQGLAWGDIYLKGEERESFRRRLIENRIKLKRLLYANSVNPAAAVFGESQVGKSYMVDCLLTSDKEVLNVYDGYGKATGFIESINPLGGGKEATSLISRFTTQQVWKDAEYPIKATMLSPIDVVIVLLDGYFNDVINHNFPKADAIKEEISRIVNKYGKSQSVQNAITEDEIYELKEYLTSILVLRGEAFRMALVDNKYFESLARVISHVPISQWGDVFGFLWNKNEILTNVFQSLVNTLGKMDFSRTVYIKLDSVLRKGGTLLHVDRLYELFEIEKVVDEKGDARTIEAAAEPLMSVLTDDGKKLEGISKSEFCALAMEIAFTIVNEERKDALLEEKPFLVRSDVLDFPGARSRRLIDESIISKMDACSMILRGKVAYLFNKYSQQYLITNLLFCHHDVKSEVVTLSTLLKGWVENTVGKTPEERADYMRTAEVSPLFLIGTKFNIDLKKDPNDSKGDEDDRRKAMDYRWTKRFDMLSNLIGPSAKNTWLDNWTPREPFNNIYLLRSFEYSCQGGLFRGYQEKDNAGLWKLVYKDSQGRSVIGLPEDGGEYVLRGEEDVCEEYKEFFPKLKESFLRNDFVNKHFANSSKSWDEVASVGKDGSAWIIENLCRSSLKMSESRKKQFTRVSQEAFDVLVKSLYELYHDDNSDMELKKQIQTAGLISLSLDNLFGSDKYFFSDFISSMVVDEESLHDVVMDKINDTKVVDQTDLSRLFAIRARAGVDNTLSFDENKNRILRAYGLETEDQLNSWLEKAKLTLEEIINPPRVMNFSRIIAEAVADKWLSTYMTIEHYRNFIERGLSEAELKRLLENSIVLYRDKLNVSDRIAAKIHPFVSASNSVAEMADMLADISAEMINRFVNTMGSAYYDEEMWNNVKETISHNNFEVKVPEGRYDEADLCEDEIRADLPAVFDTFDNVDKILNTVPVDTEKLSHFSNYQEYYKWTELMKISFLATCGIPKYDIAMNNALRKILMSDIIEQDGLKEMVENNESLKSIKSINTNENN